MAEEVKSRVSSFAKIAKRGDVLKSASERILEMDKDNIKDPKAYAAGLAYITNILSGSKKTQQEIADYMGCSVKELREEYRGIIRRNRKDFLSTIGLEVLLNHYSQHQS